MRINGIALYELVGGRATLQKVHKIFYDKVYAHEWLGLFFKGIDQKIIEDQQTDFMAQSMSGPKNYCGKFPVPAHKHMMISEELFEIRHLLLTESLREAGVSEEYAQHWLKIDSAFKRSIVKQSVNDCEKRFNTDEILSFSNPRKLAS